MIFTTECSTIFAAEASCMPAGVRVRSWRPAAIQAPARALDCPSRRGWVFAFDWNRRRSNGSPICAWDRWSRGHRTNAAIRSVRDRDGNWTYQFAVVADDWLQGVTHVVRGEDLLDSTGRQIQLARLMGRAIPPAFLHHALLMKSPSQKLSKSDGDSGVRDLRAKGWSAEAVIDRATSLAGLSR